MCDVIIYLLGWKEKCWMRVQLQPRKMNVTGLSFGDGLVALRVEAREYIKGLHVLPYSSIISL